MKWIILIIPLFLFGCAFDRPAHWFTARDGYQWRAYESDCEQWYDPTTNSSGLWAKDPRTGEKYKFIYFGQWRIE